MALTDTDWVNRLISNNPWLDKNFSTDFISSLVDLVILQGITDPVQLLNEVRSTPAYEERFPGLKERRDAGFPPMSESEYIQYESVVFSLLRSYNISDVFGTGGISGSEFKSKISELISGDVTAQEFSARLDKGYASVVDNIDEVEETFRSFYGTEIGESTLLAYFLDPAKGIELIEDQVATSQVGAVASRFGLNINQIQSGRLQEGGITQKLAREGFAEVAREKGSLTKLAKIHNIEPLSDKDLSDYVFHEDPEVAAQRKQIFDTALSEFQAGGTTRFTQEGGLASLGKKKRGGY